MSRIKDLIRSYQAFIRIPWPVGVAASQRVIFCVYHESDELRLRHSVAEFEVATRQAHHEWLLFDLTDTFPAWFTSQKYARHYFDKPELLASIIGTYKDFIRHEFTRIAESVLDNPNAVIAVLGAGSLYGLIKVKEVTEYLEGLVQGRLLIFFPGSCENNNYRLLDGYDGWNYHAIPITADQKY
jgi:hypothetical protein